MTTAAPLVARPRLLRSLAGWWKVATLAAPPGWGKTTLAAQLAGRGDALWVTLAREERDPARLLGALLASGSRLAPPLGTRALSLFAARRDFERDGGLITASFLHELAARARPLLVVLDDAHELAGARTALVWLGQLVERSPPTVRFVIAARGESPFPPARFEALGERVMGRRELGFDPAETRTLFARCQVPAARRAGIAARQAGWPAGLAIAARTAAAGEQAEGEAWATLAARLLAPLPPSKRRDLLRASLLDDLEPGVLAAALGRERAASLAAEVRRRSLFLDPGPGPGRFHPLFLEMLRDLAARELPERERRETLARAARALSAAGDRVRALGTLASAGLGGEALRAFERAATGDPAAHEPLGVLAQRWLAEGTPPKAAESPAVLAAAARADAEAGRHADADARARAAVETWRARGRPLEAARAFWIVTHTALQTGRLSAAIGAGESLARRLRGAPRARRAAAALIAARVAALRLHAGDPARARSELDHALRRMEGITELDHALCRMEGITEMERAETAMHRATVEFTAGRWDDFLARARRALDIYRHAGYWGRAHALLLNMAEAYIYLGEEPVARAHLDEAAALAPRSGTYARSVLLELSRARAWSEEGRLAEAARAFRLARSTAAHGSTPRLDAMLDTWEGVLERRRGRFARAASWLGRAEVAFTGLESPSWSNVARLERALVEGLAGRFDESLATLAACERTSRRLGDLKEAARVRLFAARVRQRAGRPFAADLAAALRALDRQNYRVLLRKERDVAGPLMAAATEARPGARGRPAEASPRRGARARADDEHALGSRGLRARPGGSARRAGRTAQALAGGARVRLLGGFTLDVGGDPRLPARTAARQLIALLALRSGRPQGREALAECLWPGASPEASRNRFDVALSEARRTLEPGAGPRGPFRLLRGDSGMLWLDPAVECDVERFESLATQAEREGTTASYRRALAACGGELLPEWRDAAWAEDARERLRGRLHRMLLAAARAALARREPQRALEAAERVLAEDPLHEEALAAALNALAACGRRSEAVRLYGAHESRCRRELDATPGPELVSLAVQLGVAKA